MLIARAGTTVNHKRLYRLYRAAGLQVRRRRRKRLTRGERVPLPTPTRPGERWSMDFTLDTLADGRAFRTLNIVDDYTRECVAIRVAEVSDVGFGAPGRSRTCDPRLRRPMLYPLSYGRQDIARLYVRSDEGLVTRASRREGTRTVAWTSAATLSAARRRCRRTGVRRPTTGSPNQSCSRVRDRAAAARQSRTRGRQR